MCWYVHTVYQSPNWLVCVDLTLWQLIKCFAHVCGLHSLDGLIGHTAATTMTVDAQCTLRALRCTVPCPLRLHAIQRPAISLRHFRLLHAAVRQPVITEACSQQHITKVRITHLHPTIIVCDARRRRTLLTNGASSSKLCTAAALCIAAM